LIFVYFLLTIDSVSRSTETLFRNVLGMLHSKVSQSSPQVGPF